MRKTWMFGSMALLLAGCVPEDEELGAADFAATKDTLEVPVKVPADFQEKDPDLIIDTAPFFLEAGESVYFNARGVTTSSDSEVRMQALWVHCTRTEADGSEVPAAKIMSSENRNGTSVHRSQTVRLLLTADVSADYHCRLEADVKDFDGVDRSVFHTYLPGDTFITRSSVMRPGYAWRWGTENDPLYDDSDEAVHFGPGTLAGGGEYALRSRRITVPADKSFLDTRFEIEATNCKWDNKNCPGVQGGWTDQWDDVGFDARIVVQQMAGPTSSTVCRTTSSPVQRVTITSDEVHKKAHLVLDDVPVSSACPGRTFIIKALLEHRSGGNPVRVEPGVGGVERWSTGFAWAHN